mgnify:CR=1 FL=1
MIFTTTYLTEKINEYISSLDYNHEPHELYNPIDYVLEVGGKRVRPLLMLMSYNLFKDDIESILPQAAAIEMYHNHTLLHDDLMDKADLRRNRPTVHKKWDENSAILSGDTMLILAYKYMCECDNIVLDKVVSLFTNTAIEICQGQQWDIQFEKMDNVTIDQYIEMIRLKTAVLLSAALKIGAIKAGATDKDADYLYNFGINIGLAFQLQDDYLDVYGDSKTFGKSIGGDIISNKKTFMLLSALNNGNEEQKSEILRWISMAEFDPKEKIKAITKIYNEQNIDKFCFKLIDSYFEKGLKYLDSVDVQESKKSELRDFVMKMMRRKV